MAKRQTSLQKENLDPANFVGQAWKLIEKTREQVLRPQSNAEYLVEHGGSHEAGETVVERILSADRVAFKKLCNKEETYTEIPLNDAGTGRTIEVAWKVYTTEKAFDNLFWRYWNDLGEKWKDPKQAEEQGKLKFDGYSVQMYSEEEQERLAKLARDADAWKWRGKQKLGEWKHAGIPPVGFLALERFRREHDKRALNLKKKPTNRNLNAH
jgi:hypothetical protein